MSTGRLAGLSRQIPAETKAEYLRALVGVGFKQIDAVSFVSPRAVPQMADSEDVLKRLDPPDDVEIIGIVVNEKGAERAIATDAVRTLGFPYSISETFLKKNQNQTAEENSDALESVWRKTEENGLTMVAYISMALATPMAICGTSMNFCRRCRILLTWAFRRFHWQTPWV